MYLNLRGIVVFNRKLNCQAVYFDGKGLDISKVLNLFGDFSTENLQKINQTTGMHGKIGCKEKIYTKDNDFPTQFKLKSVFVVYIYIYI